MQARNLQRKAHTEAVPQRPRRASPSKDCVKAPPNKRSNAPRPGASTAPLVAPLLRPCEGTKTMLRDFRKLLSPKKHSLDCATVAGNCLNSTAALAALATLALGRKGALTTLSRQRCRERNLRAPFGQWTQILAPFPALGAWTGRQGAVPGRRARLGRGFLGVPGHSPLEMRRHLSNSREASCLSRPPPARTGDLSVDPWREPRVPRPLSPLALLPTLAGMVYVF